MKQFALMVGFCGVIALAACSESDQTEEPALKGFEDQRQKSAPESNFSLEPPTSRSLDEGGIGGTGNGVDCSGDQDGHDCPQQP